MTDRTHAVAVAEGSLHVGEWHRDAEGLPWLLVHGVTASHLAWAWVASETPDVRLIAPDLRGRGRSADVGGPFGMAAHADDLAAVLDAAGVERARSSSGIPWGRSCRRCSPTVILSGGRGGARRRGTAPGSAVGDAAREAIRHVLGPTAARLDMRFPDAEAYRDFWRSHPRFLGREDPLLDEYFAMTWSKRNPGAAATSPATVEADSLDQNTGSDITRALDRMPRPTVLLAAERGLRGEIPPLYPDLSRVRREVPGLRDARRSQGTDHYSIVMSAEGAREVAAAARAVTESL